MSNSVIALSVTFAIVLVSSGAAFYAGSRHKMNLEQWTVAGRGFGVLLVWVLMAGEVYTTFSFLGASGWVYSRGAPALYILAYITLAYAGSYFIAPRIWEVGRRYGMQTQSDFFEKRYGSKYLAAFVSLVGIAFIIPYLQLQLTGLGIIVEMASYGGISQSVAMVISFALVAAFVYSSGIRGAAWISIVKDLLLLSAVVFMGIVLPYMYFGGIDKMFDALIAAKPAHLTLPGSTKLQGDSWYMSTVLLTSLGFYMWPHLFGALFSAKSSNTLRRNAVFMPLYTISLPFVFLVGFTAILVTPGLSNGDLSLLTIVQKSFPAWFLGIIGAAGALTAMVPAAVLILAASTLFAKNFWRPIISPGMSDDQVATLAKALVIVVTAIALYLAIYSSTTLVSLLLTGYSGVTQFFPGVTLGLFWRRVTMPGVFAGLVVGVGAVLYLMLNGLDPFFGLNAGFVGLCLNFVVTITVSLLTSARASAFDEPAESSMAQ
jgi:SSS family solute:Na+ symporter